MKSADKSYYNKYNRPLCCANPLNWLVNEVIGMALTEFIMASWDGYALQGKLIFTPPMVYSTEDVAIFCCSCFMEIFI